MRIQFRFSKEKDPDFIAIRKKIGDKNLGKLVRIALRTLTNPSLDRDRISELLESKTDSLVDEDSVFSVSIKSRKDRALIEILEHLKSGTRGAFTKILTRQILGTKVILPYFLEDDFSIGPIVQYSETLIASLRQPDKIPPSKRKPKPVSVKRSAPKVPKTIEPREEPKEAPIKIETPPTFAPLPDIIPAEEPKEAELSADDALAMLENILN